jgi:hypothetical protein
VSRTRTIAAVGLADEELAHLRLLVRRSEQELDERWAWGEENHADLLVVDPGEFAGQMARTRAQGAGIRVAVFSDAPVEGPELRLHRPLVRAQVVEVLNGISRGAIKPAEIGAHTDDFYTRDLGEDADAGARPRDAALPPAAGLDELLRMEPAELRRTPALPRTPTAPPAEGAPPAAPASAPPRRHATFEGMSADIAPHDLRDYLVKDLLKAPARYALEGAPPLALDPKRETAHAPGGLGALLPYCRARWRLADWQPLTSADLAELRATQAARPYAHLLWLYTLAHSGGRLAGHLDPGGTYRLRHWLEIERELGSRYFRIGSAMLQPVRLHEIAAAAEAPMSDVFDVVNAYEAIGLLEWQPRARRDDRLTPPRPRASLLRKLRKPFRRR